MRIVYLMLFIVGFTSLQAQQGNNWCGTEITPEWMQAFYQRDKSHLQHKSGNLPETVIPITYHIVGKYDGSGYYTLPELFRSHCELQSLYDSANVRFYIESINYINNTPYYNGVNTNDLMLSYNNPVTCNVYYVNTMDGVCGYSFVPEPWDGNGYEGPNRGGLVLQRGVCKQITQLTDMKWDII